MPHKWNEMGNKPSIIRDYALAVRFGSIKFSQGLFKLRKDKISGHLNGSDGLFAKAYFLALKPKRCCVVASHAPNTPSAMTKPNTSDTSLNVKKRQPMFSP